MGSFHFIATLLVLVSVLALSVEATFPATMNFTWGASHSTMLPEDLSLIFDNTSGSGVISKLTFFYGSSEMLIKLVPGNSAGTVTAYYMSSTGSTHDEIDFEFLGNVSGQPYTVHTNIYTLGNGSREEQFKLWFDPTADYHNYTIHWNPSAIVWYIDSIPIRVFRNYQSQGIPFPSTQGMNVYASIWNGESWATRGGLDKINWASAPFIARFRNFRPRFCTWNGPASIAPCSAKTAPNWWTWPSFAQLSASNLAKMKSVRSRFMIYNYCTDTKRFNGVFPPECFKSQF